MSSKSTTQDMVPGRGEKGKSTPIGTSLFVGLRGIDPFLQRYILLSTPFATLLPKISLSAPSPPPTGDLTLPFAPGMTPFQSLIWTMSIGSAVKQIFWILYLSKEPMYPQGSLFICAFNTLFNTANSLLFTLQPPAQWYPWQIYIGAAFYASGILIETISEIQRKAFKDAKGNEGKPYSGGLFSLARSINYGGYTLWRGGYALAAGGPVWGAIAGCLMAWDFTSRAIPVMDEYCSKRYGAQWERVKQKVPYVLLPYIY